MKKIHQVLLVLFFISVSVLNFEILATRISSVIFVNSFGFIILSLAIMGLAAGAIYEYYRENSTSEVLSEDSNLFRPVLLHCLSIFLFVGAVTQIEAITTPLLFFIFLLFPFVFAGIFYSRVFRIYSEDSFKIYASDLSGAAIGSLMPLLILPTIGPINGILVISLLLIALAASIILIARSRKVVGYILVLGCVLSSLAVSQFSADFLGKIPIGEFEEKDIYHVYDDPTIQSTITDSRWSIFGRSDLVEHSHQNIVKHIFIDGAAGSQMYRFGGDISQLDPTLSSLLLQFTNSVPFLLLEPEQKNSMLVIGPGGGREVLTGLISGMGSITGVEINSDFVQIVKDEAAYNGGLYTSFPNVNIQVKEGRQYVKETDRRFDAIVMALPSTQQLQSIESYALSENYLLTVEALSDYLDILTEEGQLIFTVHNDLEMKKLITTAIKAFEERGVDRPEVLNHFLAVEQRFSPTLVISKQPYTQTKVNQYLNFVQGLPNDLPAITYLPYNWGSLPNTQGNALLTSLRDRTRDLASVTEASGYNISPVYDDSPYFYNIEKNIPGTFVTLFTIVIAFVSLIIFVPYFIAGRKERKPTIVRLRKFLFLFLALGAGFMLLELALFQKLILYLGSPTISLSVLLCSILVGMGLGSATSNLFGFRSTYQKIYYYSIAVVIGGGIAILLYPAILELLLGKDIFIRGAVSFLLILPLGYVLGVPFPASIRALKESQLEEYVPWMYGVNGATSILGSVSMVIISMIYGFTAAFIAGLLLYLGIVVLMYMEKDYS